MKSKREIEGTKHSTFPAHNWLVPESRKSLRLQQEQKTHFNTLLLLLLLLLVSMLASCDY
jgi:hypothetical protein